MDEKILDSAGFNAVFGIDAIELDGNQRRGIYSKKVDAMLRDNDKEATARWLLNEFNNNRPMVEWVKNDLCAWVGKIPMKFCGGAYFSGKKFFNDTGREFNGPLLKMMIVAKEYQEFARFLNCQSIKGILYDDIDCKVDELTREDIADFQSIELKYGNDCICAFINDDKVSKELIEEFDLGVLDGRGVDEDDHEFPSGWVKDRERLQRTIRNAPLNRFLKKEKLRIVTETETSFDERGYALEMYRSDDVHFCQKCKKPTKHSYIEVNAIEKEPKYAWEQMRLSLCLNCSKDYESIRGNNHAVHNAFLNELRSVNVDGRQPIAVKLLGEITISFTPTHLAEVQEILKLQDELE